MTGRASRGRVDLLLAIAAAVFLIGVALRGGLRDPAAAPPPSPGGFQKGMVFGLFARDDAGHTEKGLAELKALGVDSVSITIPWVIADVRAVTMAPRADMTPSDGALVFAIGRAHALGLRVFLMPFLFVDHMEGDEWRGTLRPPDWGAWFAAYEGFILHYAKLAESQGVEYFSVGSELCSTESRRDEWLALIAKVRQAYRGRITYSSNWDHRDGLVFAEAIDFLGMNAYFKLSDAESPAEDDLVRAWEPVRAEVEEWRRGLGKPLVITEVGYPSRRGAGTDPWNYEAAGAPDLEGQLRCYRAFRRVWGGDPHLQGVYFYLWWGDGGPGDSGYTPRGKPAEQVVREWFTH